MRKYKIDSDGITVWVNTPSHCIGRFGTQGIDIHRVPGDVASNTECLYCTHTPVSAKDWLIFVQKMKELHAVRVPKSRCPKRLRREVARLAA